MVVGKLVVLQFFGTQAVDCKNKLLLYMTSKYEVVIKSS